MVSFFGICLFASSGIYFNSLPDTINHNARGIHNLGEAGKRSHRQTDTGRQGDTMNVKILVVDDSRIMRNIVKNTLKSMYALEDGFLEAANGEEAFNILEAQHIDIMLLDWNMPFLNGVDLVRRLRQMEKYKNLPIIMVTSEAAKYNVIEAVKAGVNDYLVKPVTEKNLFEKVKKYLPA
jgi:two-component system chemotaxis response regulator CheY